MNAEVDFGWVSWKRVAKAKGINSQFVSNLFAMFDELTIMIEGRVISGSTQDVERQYNQWASRTLEYSDILAEKVQIPVIEATKILSRNI